MDNTANDSIALIDIGSNSVRMVVYHAAHRVPLPLYNEKHLCGLGSDLSQTGALSAEGKQEAMHALKRFALMRERQRIKQIYILATAAIRDASDGAAFRKEVEALFGEPVQVIDGETEAQLAALGIIASFAAPDGLVADLGGGSMELATLKDAKVEQHVSTALGVLRNVEHEETLQVLNTHKDAIGKQRTLYAVGGSFRAIAKMHMRQTAYPLTLLHGYKLHLPQVKRIARQMQQLSHEAIADLPGIPKRRAATMPYASQLLADTMEHFGCERVVFSVSGIREGHLYEMLSSDAQRQDPLLASSADLALFAERHGYYANELFEWTEPLFATMPPEWERLRRAACILSEIAWRIDPNFRGEWLYHRVLQSSLKGMSHRERVMVSLALYHRHENKWKQETGPLALIDERERLWAKAVGLSLRAASELTGGASRYLLDNTLNWEDGQLHLAMSDQSQPLRSAALEKCLVGLEESLSALSNLTI